MNGGTKICDCLIMERQGAESKQLQYDKNLVILCCISFHMIIVCAHANLVMCMTGGKPLT